MHLPTEFCDCEVDGDGLAGDDDGDGICDVVDNCFDVTTCNYDPETGIVRLKTSAVFAAVAALLMEPATVTAASKMHSSLWR